MLLRPLIFLLALPLLAATPDAPPADRADALARSVEADLTENILPFWMERTVDPDGGFYGTVLNDGTALSGSDKGAILNARILWTFSRAFRIYGLDAYKETADRAADYYKTCFIDPKYGGVFWSVDAEGHPKETVKQTYAIAFGIYGLSEHFRATGDPGSLAAAQALFRTLQDKVHDPVRKGYFEVFARDWSRSDAKGIDGRGETSKTMNTHIHVMEAFTNLYAAWPDPEVRDAILELLDILRTHLYDARTHHLILYCDDDWGVVDTADSFGHDIETSWLLCEAAEAVGDATLVAEVRRQALAMVDTALAEGLAADGLMRYERNARGYSRNVSWWPQCETVIGCINAWQLTGQQKYFDAAEKTWNYICAHFIDRKDGGWFKDLAPDGKTPFGPKASTWNCPYHNARMGFELRSRLERPAVHTEVMAWSNITGVRCDGELVDFESSVRAGVPGGDIEASGREKQPRIRYMREGATQTTVTPLRKGVTFTQRVTDVDPSTVRLAWEVKVGKAAEGGAYFCMAFGPDYYADARIKASGRKVDISAPERHITLTFNKSVKTQVREEGGDKVLYVTFLPRLAEGAEAAFSAEMKVSGVQHHEPARIALDFAHPGRVFAGFGGNFRLQNVQKDPAVIDYCLRNLRVAFGRVEMPWSQWDRYKHPEAENPAFRGFGGNPEDHVRRSAGMARRLKAVGMPVIVSCWFPPMWACTATTRSDGSAYAFSLKEEETERIYASLAEYLLFLRDEYGVEADYFSFNESDLGIDVVHTPAEHCAFIKGFGAYLAAQGLKTLMLLGDNSDATTFDFIVPTLRDPEARRYVGAISFHSWRGCDDATLQKWAAAAREINVPLIVGEGSTDAAAHQYPGIFNETTFALYEINLYTRLCAICQPLSILQWQLTSDYSLLWGDGIYGSDGPLRPTQRFWNIRQLALTPADAFAIPASCDKANVNVAAFANTARGQSAVHVVNNAAACTAEISGLPAAAQTATVLVTNARQHAEVRSLPVRDGCVAVEMPAESFVSVFVQ